MNLGMMHIYYILLHNHQLYSHKYLVNGEGRAIKSYGHRVQPMDIESDIVALLNENEEEKMQVPQTH